MRNRELFLSTNLKPPFLALVLTAFFYVAFPQTAFATFVCASTVAQIAVGYNGDLVLTLNNAAATKNTPEVSGFRYEIICNVNNDISTDRGIFYAQACRGWLSELLAAYSSEKPVLIWFGDGTTCSGSACCAPGSPWVGMQGKVTAVSIGPYYK
jgi:hypothetical protein